MAEEAPLGGGRGRHSVGRIDPRTDVGGLAPRAALTTTTAARAAGRHLRAASDRVRPPRGSATVEAAEAAEAEAAEVAAARAAASAPSSMPRRAR